MIVTRTLHPCPSDNISYGLRSGGIFSLAGRICHLRRIPACLSGFCVALLPFLLLQGCARIATRESAPPPPFQSAEIQRLLSSLEAQDRNVQSCFGNGRLTVEHKDAEEDINILVAGQRKPFRVRIEITHPWGRPLLYMVMSESGVRVLAFSQRRLYRGQPEDVLLPRLLPVPLAPGPVWSLVRGFPLIAEHARAISLAGNEVTLLAQNDAIIETIAFRPDSRFPIRVSFADLGVMLLFSPFEEKEGIQWARRVALVHAGSNTRLELEVKDRVYNRQIPPSLFELEVPSGYEVRDLNTLRIE